MSTTEGSAPPAAAETADADALAARIGDLGQRIRAAKAAGQAPDVWRPMLEEMVAAKTAYEALTGAAFGPPSAAPKKAPAADPDAGQQEASEKNKEKRALKAAEKARREAEKEAKRAERAQREQEKRDRLAGAGQTNFGDAPLVQSAGVTDRTWTAVGDLQPALAGRVVLVRGHLQKSRMVGKGAFVVVRSSLYSVQGVVFESKEGPVSAAMVKYIAGLPAESVVDMQGTLTVPDAPVESVTQKTVEIQISAFHCVCKANASLPFLIEDAMRPESAEEAVGEYNEDFEIEHDDGLIHVGQKIRLDYRWLDLRTPANQAIFRIESMVGCLFREFLVHKGFVEIHTPKLIGGASEGGSEVFKLNYFGQPACLAMSPQLHKQMTAASSGFERVFETGPVFRAENSNTRRHLCEFTGFDFEMVIHEHYNEALEVFNDLFIYIFDGLNERCKVEIERVREQYPFKDLKYLRPTLKLTYAEGCALLREAGIGQSDYDDLSTENEKKLGDLVAEKFGTDFFFLDKFPLAVRPFYTMPDPRNPNLSNSYDFFIRGQEILSGAQRIHDPQLLEDRAKVHGIDLKDIKAYVDSFRHGTQPHAGGGIGLERVVMLFLGLTNIRKSAWFPRDPKRISP